MKNWFDGNDRDAGTQAFCAFLDNPANKATRDACTVTMTNYKDPRLLAVASALARNTFAAQGGFVKEEDYPQGSAPQEAIPRDINFCIYEEGKFPRDYMVVMVLPPQGHVPTGNSWDVFDIYRCTWSPWAAFENDQWQSGNK